MGIKDLVEVNSNKLSGLPVFAGTRVPISYLFEYLEKGETLPEFLRQFPSVTHEQALGVLELSKESVLHKVSSMRPGEVYRSSNP